LTLLTYAIQGILTILAQACLPALAKTRSSFIAKATGSPYKEDGV